LQHKINTRRLDIAIIGFGYIGTCIGAVLAEKGFRVTGVDEREEVAEETNRGKTSINEPGLKDLITSNVLKQRLSATTDFSRVKETDVIIITVGTPLGENYEPDLNKLVAASREISKYLRRGHIVILKSTVPPYTTENIVKPILQANGLSETDFALAFCPERLAEGRAIMEFQSIPVVVGGVNHESTKSASLFWREVLGVETIEVTNARTAEMTKLADNMWIDLNIALANEIAMLSDKLSIDALEVIDAANTLPKVNYNVNILIPSMGVGGSCLTKDPWFLYHLARKYGLELRTPVCSRGINDTMPRYTFDLIKQELEKLGKKLRDSKVSVLGIAFKNNTGDCRSTPTKFTIELLESSGCELSICDPWVNGSDAALVTSRPLVPTIEEAIKDADCIAFLTGHTEFKNFPIEKIAQLANPNAVVVDGRNLFSRQQIKMLIDAGLSYKGIGR
jgi:UDP-N-acetyl-D-mannosaminuronic acid dehydrogenase